MYRKAPALDIEVFADTTAVTGNTNIVVRYAKLLELGNKRYLVAANGKAVAEKRPAGSYSALILRSGSKFEP